MRQVDPPTRPAFPGLKGKIDALFVMCDVPLPADIPVRPAMNPEDTPPKQRILVYSSNRDVRAQVMNALGRRPAADVPEVDIVETATEPATVAAMDAGDIDLAILDGEAYPGGMGMARALKDEIFECPPILVITGRPQDAWLATWSRADAVVPRPLSPFDLARATAELLRRRIASAPST